MAASSLKAMILRNGWYTENLTGGIASVIKSGTIIGSSANGRFSAATREDYAEAEAAVLTSDRHAGRIYELGGDGAFTRAQLAAEIARQTGRDIQYRNLSEADYAAALRNAACHPKSRTCSPDWILKLPTTRCSRRAATYARLSAGRRRRSPPSSP